MKELLEKISSYNLFNYLFPGAVFVFILKTIMDITLTNDNIFESFFIYYFIGLIMSRIGSLIIEPLVTKTKWFKYAPYSDYLNASKKDTKIELFTEVNNMYRTLLSTTIVLFFIDVFLLIYSWPVPLQKLLRVFFLAMLMLLFLSSYKKQTDYVKKRITNAIQQEN
jgi:hypothetical protein